MDSILDKNYLDIAFCSFSQKSKEIIDRRNNLLSNLKNRTEDKIYFNQRREWKTLELGYLSKKVLEDDIKVLEKAGKILKIYDKYFDASLNKIVNNSLFLTIIKTSYSPLEEEYFNSIIR